MRQIQIIGCRQTSYDTRKIIKLITVKYWNNLTNQWKTEDIINAFATKDFASIKIPGWLVTYIIDILLKWFISIIIITLIANKRM